MKTQVRPKIPYLNLSVKDLGLKEELLKAVDQVLSHGRIVLGPEVEQFEKKVAKYCGRNFAVGVNSGTDAVYLALRSLGVGSGDEVITTPLSWIATVNAIALCGATPVFADIREDFNINPDLIESVITKKTKAILPVHYTGKICDMEKILAIAKRHQIPIVEDSAQAFGAMRGGKPAGSFGKLSCFSMNPMKVYCAYGEAGAVLTDDEALREKLVSLRYNGTVNKEACIMPSLNGRLDTIQAAMLLVSIKYLKAKIARRRRIAAFYTDALGDIVSCPHDDAGALDIYYTYMIIVERRDELKEYLASVGIETKIHHPILMPDQQAYLHLPRPNIPVAGRLVKRILSLPNHENLTDEDTAYIAQNVRNFYEKV